MWGGIGTLGKPGRNPSLVSTLFEAPIALPEAGLLLEEDDSSELLVSSML
jgi:hypothetical protein